MLIFWIENEVIENILPTISARSREEISSVSPNVGCQILDLTALTDQEEKIIQAVIQKDDIEKNIVDAKLR